MPGELASKSSAKAGPQFKIKPYDVHLVGGDIYIHQEQAAKKRDGSQEESKHPGSNQRANQEPFNSQSANLDFH